MKKIHCIIGLTAMAVSLAILSLQNSFVRTNISELPDSSVTAILSTNVSDTPALTAPQAPRIYVAEDTSSESIPAAPDNEHTPEEMSESLKALIRSGNPQRVMSHFATQRKLRAEKIQLDMATQGVDHQWEHQLNQAFESSRARLPQLKALTVSQTDCRETVCAINLYYTDEDKHSRDKVKHYMAYVGNVLGRDTFFHHDASDGLAVLYIARQNSTLPTLDEPEES